ncbi:MAG: crossover junction endodeoxyribonuclease RuvC [Phycisphaeraceae bacterium]|nr:crossover junction endodeoxyribonuclease RuvC [Phycisphaeraceae bacterium]
MRVLGVDPGLRLTGYGCVDGGVARASLLEAGVFRLCGSSPAPSISARLAELDRDFRELLERVAPDAVGVEQLFAHYKHPSTAIAMGHARGVILLAIERAGVPLIEVRPTAVKKSMTGHGHASKEQIQRAIQDRFRLEHLPKPPDVADALAIALYALSRAAGRAQPRDTIHA